MKSIKIRDNRLFSTFFILIQLLCNIPNTSNVLYAEEFINKESSIQYKDKDKDNEKIKIEYLLGPGDVIFINFLEASFLNGSYTIPQEGNINLPEIDNYKLEGKTIPEIERELENLYKDILYIPDIKINIISYRPLNIYLRGEVSRPGLYTFEGINTNNNYVNLRDKNIINENLISEVRNPNVQFKKVTLFETIAEAKGVSNYADLSNVIVYRNNSITNGGGRIKASINLLSLIENGDQSQNIRMFDGDTVYVPKGERMLRDQILNINKSNLSPEEISIFVTGNVEVPGNHILMQGSSLNQAIATTGGRKIFSGKINFIRFNADGTTTKNSFYYDESAPINSKRNPILMSGDIVDVNRSIFGTANFAISEVARPLVNSYGLYKLFTDN